MLEFGVEIQILVSPILNLFTVKGFAPLLAFLMACVAFLVGASVYLFYIAGGKAALRKAARTARSIEGQTDFANRFDEIDATISKIKIIRHAWQEFKETIIPPDSESDGRIKVFRNTVRPFVFFNISEVGGTLRLHRLHFVSNLLIGIGLLLTFIGLVAALTEAGTAIGASTDGADFQEPIKKLLAVAAFKFWTSVSGLGCSILLRVFYEIHHNSVKKLLSQFNSGIERGLQFATPELLAIEQLREAQEQSAAMKRFSTDVAISLTNAMQPVNDSLVDIGNRISGGIGDALKDAAGSEMQALAHNLSGIVESLNSSKSEMDGMASIIRTTMTDAAEALRSASGSASNEMAEQMKAAIGSLSEESRNQARLFEDSMSKLSNIIEKSSEAAGGTISQAAHSLANGMNGVSDGVRDAASGVAERMSNLSYVMQNVEQRMSNHIEAMDALTGKARDAEQAMGSTSRMLTEAATPISQATERMANTTEQLNQSINTVKEAITESHNNLAMLSQKMSETQQTLQSSWQNYDQRFSNVDESLGKALDGIVDNVKSNIQIMEEFVRNMDQNLGAAIRTFSQSISELNETAEDFESASSNLLTSVNQIANKGT